MRSGIRSALLVVSLAFASSGAPAQDVPGKVLGSFPLSLKTPTGMTWDGSHLWVADLDTATLNEVDPTTGKLLRRVDSPGYAPMGLAWDGKRLWVVDAEEKTAFAWNPATGLTERALPTDTDTVRGIAWDGERLWTVDAGAGVIARIDGDDGTTYSSLPSPNAKGGRRGESLGLCFAGGALLVSDRTADAVYRMDPGTGAVLNAWESPGPYPAGLAYDGRYLWSVDYETRTLYRHSLTFSGTYIRRDPKRESVRFVESWRNLGPGTVKELEVFLAVPQDLPNQKVLTPPTFAPEPAGFVSDRWGQKCARFLFRDVKPGQEVTASMTVEAELYRVRWFVDPALVGKLEEIPPEISSAYTGDSAKFDMANPIIRTAVKEAVGDEKNPYWMAWKINRAIQEKMHYEMVGGWNVAPVVLARGSGSCSEYTFAMLSMCHAAGLPARYAGSVVVRGDDASRDDVFHRWVEVYLPNYGWFPVDPSGGDSPVPSEVAGAFGGLDNRFLITTLGAGDSETLGWDYNSNARWTAEGRVRILHRKAGDWEPVGKRYEPRVAGQVGGLGCEPGK